MMLRRIDINKLYFMYTYSIDFTKNDSQIQIITSPNGYGKTSILEIIDSIINGRFVYFYTFDFESLAFEFNNGDIISVKMIFTDGNIETGQDMSDNREKKVVFTYKNSGKSSEFSFELNKKNVEKEVFRITGNSLLSKNPYSDEFIDFVRENQFVYEGMALNTSDFMQFKLLLQRNNALFINSQRLNTQENKNDSQIIVSGKGFPMAIGNRQIKKITSINKIINSIRDKLAKAQNNYLIQSQNLDIKLVEEIFTTSKTPYSEVAYEKKKAALENKLLELIPYGLAEKFDIRPYDESKNEILTAYIDSIEKKLSIYDDLIERIKLFNEILKEKDLVNKSLAFDIKIGLKITTRMNRILSPNRLSSGEQNQIILLYYLIFEVSDNSLVLIDEPENSLHVMWQKQFIDDLLKITATKNIQVIVATHSPQIIGSRWNECYDLSENDIEEGGNR